jgi:hypothetical protein
MPRSLVYGVDFSGAKDACQRIWISKGSIVNGKLSITECSPLGRLIGDIKTDRDSCFAALRGLIEQETKAVFGLDLSFAIPVSLMDGEDWEDFVLDFVQRYENPEQFREKCRSAASNKEIKRHTESRNRAPFSTYNLRLFRQTFYGIRDIVHPLVRDRLACALPMQSAVDDLPWMIEICPACRLKDEGIYYPYKGTTQKELGNRTLILEHLVEEGLLISGHVRDMVLKDERADGLDSIIAAFIVFRALVDEELGQDVTDIYRREGMIFS